jgi:hypothetical protein
MKSFNLTYVALFLSLALCLGCSKYNDLGTSKLGGDPSPIADLGNTFSFSVPVDGVSSLEASVISSTDGVATITGSAIVTNSKLRTMLANYPEFSISGDRITLSGLKLKSTTKGFEIIEGFEPGVLVLYDSKAGDTYSIEGSNKKREVVSKSSTDDYSYGFYDIKVQKIEESVNKFGINKLNYYANHRFGIVGIEFVFDDGTVYRFPIYSFNENDPTPK